MHRTRCRARRAQYARSAGCHEIGSHRQGHQHSLGKLANSSHVACRVTPVQSLLTTPRTRPKARILGHLLLHAQAALAAPVAICVLPLQHELGPQRSLDTPKTRNTHLSRAGGCRDGCNRPHAVAVDANEQKEARRGSRQCCLGVQISASKKQCTTARLQQR